MFSVTAGMKSEAAEVCEKREEKMRIRKKI